MGQTQRIHNHSNMNTLLQTHIQHVVILSNAWLTAFHCWLVSPHTTTTPFAHLYFDNRHRFSIPIYYAISYGSLVPQQMREFPHQKPRSWNQNQHENCGFWTIERADRVTAESTEDLASSSYGTSNKQNAQELNRNNIERGLRAIALSLSSSETPN